MELMSIKRKAISIAEQYEIEIFEKKQELLALAILIAMADDVIQAVANKKRSIVKLSIKRILPLIHPL